MKLNTDFLDYYRVDYTNFSKVSIGENKIYFNIEGSNGRNMYDLHNVFFLERRDNIKNIVINKMNAQASKIFLNTRNVYAFNN